jgi:hypothetical protein
MIESTSTQTSKGMTMNRIDTILAIIDNALEMPELANDPKVGEMGQTALLDAMTTASDPRTYSDMNRAFLAYRPLPRPSTSCPARRGF